MPSLSQIRPEGKPCSGTDAQTFASKKFDTLKCVCFDRRLSPVDVEVHCILLQFVNETTLRCFPSQELIAQRGRLSVPHVKRSLKRLVQAR